MEWQPIETAPKDGTVVLVFEDLPWVTLARWQTEAAVGWWRDQTAAEYSVGECHPTHWMPLPAPPLPKETATA